ncbi:hypothetical protein [Bacterioplanes sanyensis]|nr:hypothetical protein [Bacterioplanes sanyensis]
MSLAMLKQAQPFLCEHCYQVNRLSDAELQVLLNVLGRFGYRTSR